MSVQPNSPSPNNWMPWKAVFITVAIVVVLSAFTATKKWAYWIGGATLIAILLPAWRKAGYPTGF